MYCCSFISLQSFSNNSEIENNGLVPESIFAINKVSDFLDQLLFVFKISISGF
jgi:hypothetical protein